MGIIDQPKIAERMTMMMFDEEVTVFSKLMIKCDHTVKAFK